ncbi:hypothetical protein NL676_034201 [Syzygium grande]|nr:hypothetical protein NL676_034201 [Syzygium grande]
MDANRTKSSLNCIVHVQEQSFFACALSVNTKSLEQESNQSTCSAPTVKGRTAAFLGKRRKSAKDQTMYTGDRERKSTVASELAKSSWRNSGKFINPLTGLPPLRKANVLASVSTGAVRLRGALGFDSRGFGRSSVAYSTAASAPQENYKLQIYQTSAFNFTISRDHLQMKVRLRLE